MKEEVVIVLKGLPSNEQTPENINKIVANPDKNYEVKKFERFGWNNKNRNKKHQTNPNLKITMKIGRIQKKQKNKLSLNEKLRLITQHVFDNCRKTFPTYKGLVVEPYTPRVKAFTMKNRIF